MPRSPDPIDRTSDDYNCCDSDVYSINYADDIYSQLESGSIGDCDSGANDVNGNYSGPSDNDDSVYYTDDMSYRPKKADNGRCDNNVYFNYTDNACCLPDRL